MFWTRFGQSALLVLVIGAASVLLANAWRLYHEDSNVALVEASQTTPLDVPLYPFSSAPSFAAARRVIFTQPFDPEYAKRLLRHAQKYDPLNAQLWLADAELALRLGDKETAIANADMALSLWPTRGAMMWRVASVYIQAGLNDKALTLLRDYSRVYPQEFDKVVFVANRLLADKTELIDRLQPDSINPADSEIAREYRDNLFRVALNQKNAALVDAVWRAFDVESKRRASFFDRYFAFLVQNDSIAEANRMWTEVYPHDEMQRIVNGGFEAPIANSHKGWSTIQFPGYRFGTDNKVFYSGSKSAKIEFLGERNLVFRHFYQYVPVQPSSRVIVTGVWRGEEVTTRPGVSFEVATQFTQERRRAFVGPLRKTWHWSRFRLELETTSDTYFVVVRLVRPRSDHLDNKIAGSVWIDDISVELVHGS